MYSGVFDSSVQRQNKNKSPLRRVTHYELELFHINGGVSHVNGNAYPVKRGMLLCARPGDVRYSDFPVRCSFIRISPSGREEACECERIIEKLPQVAYLGDDKKVDELRALFEKLAFVFVSPQMGDDDLECLRINSLLFEILCRITKVCKGGDEERRSAPATRVVREAYEYINENFSGDCSLSAIAAAVHISPNYLHTVFTEQIGETPFEYTCKKRIEKAKLLISAGEKSMIDIALETGFCSQSHFNKVFKLRCGISPAQYRKSLVLEY